MVLRRPEISPISFSASGSTPTSPCLILRMTDIAGVRVTTMSPNSVIVLSLRTICSSASLAWVTILFVFLTSASSFAKTDACCVSCFCIEPTTLLKICESLSLSLADVPSSFATCTWICLVARSSLGFKGPGFRTDSFTFDEKLWPEFFSHLFWKVLILSFGTELAPKSVNGGKLNYLHTRLNFGYERPRKGHRRAENEEGCISIRHPREPRGHP